MLARMIRLPADARHAAAEDCDDGRPQAVGPPPHAAGPGQELADQEPPTTADASAEPPF